MNNISIQNDPYIRDPNYDQVDHKLVCRNGEVHRKITYLKREVVEGERYPSSPREFHVAMLMKKITGQLNHAERRSVYLFHSERSTPRGSLNDSYSPEDLGNKPCFEDHEIIEVGAIIKEKIATEAENGRQIKVTYTKNDKPIVQQIGTRSCTGGVTAMLILEHTHSLHSNLRRDLGNDHDMKQDIKSSRLKPIKSSIKTPSPKKFITCQEISDGYYESKEHLDYIYNCIVELQEYLRANGSAIVSIDDPHIAFHVIVVDEMNLDSGWVRLRDPYHGWEITVTMEAFAKRFVPSNIIQIAKS